MRDRKKQRELHKQDVAARKEERLSKYDSAGVKDLTPYNAVERIRKGNKANITLR